MRCMQTKNDIRNRLMLRRQQVTQAVAEHAGQEIASQLDDAMDWGLVRRVHVYASVATLGEVGTGPIISWLQAQYPHIKVVVGKASPQAVFPEGQFDVIFAPLLGFDRGGFRLGLGGGWYDRWLATQPRALKIGLAYAWAEVADLPHESHDIPLDMVLTASV